MLPKRERQRPSNICQIYLPGDQAHPFTLGLHPLSVPEPSFGTRLLIQQEVCRLPRCPGPHTAFPHTNFLIRGLSFFSPPDILNDFVLASFTLSVPESSSWEQSLLPHHSHLLVPFWFLSDLYLFIFASNLSTLRACLALAAFPVMRQLTKSCVTTWLVLVSAFYLPSAVTAVAPLLISAVVILAAFS